MEKVILHLTIPVLYLLQNTAPWRQNPECLVDLVLLKKETHPEEMAAMTDDSLWVTCVDLMLAGTFFFFSKCGSF